MFTGVGNDIIEIQRIERLIKRHGIRFFNRIFTESEQQYCNQYQEAARHYAGRFAAKEAVVKALGTGFRNGITFLDIEILNDTNGKPCVFFSKSSQTIFKNSLVHVSISHCKTFATAIAIAFSTKD